MLQMSEDWAAVITHKSATVSFYQLNSLTFIKTISTKSALFFGWAYPEHCELISYSEFVFSRPDLQAKGVSALRKASENEVFV